MAVFKSWVYTALWEGVWSLVETNIIFHWMQYLSSAPQLLWAPEYSQQNEVVAPEKRSEMAWHGLCYKLCINHDCFRKFSVHNLENIRGSTHNHLSFLLFTFWSWLNHLVAFKSLISISLCFIYMATITACLILAHKISWFTYKDKKYVSLHKTIGKNGLTSNLRCTLYLMIILQYSKAIKPF